MGCSVSGDSLQHSLEEMRSYSYSTGDTTVYLFTDAVSHRVQRPHRFVYFCDMTHKTSTAAIAAIYLFHELTAPKPYVSHQNSRTKGTSLACQLIPEMIPIARNCAICAVPLSQTPPSKAHIFSCFGTCKAPYAESRKCSNGLRMRTPIHVFYFKNAENRCRISGRKSSVYWSKKHFLRWNTWVIFPNLFG